MTPPLNPFLRLIYFLLRCIAWLGVTVFYRKRYILGRENLRFKGPAIIVVNHPSTLMDVLNPCVHIRPESFFLANYGLFKNPVSNWLLTRLYCIPVKRREDVAEGEVRNNDAAFEQSFRHMERKGMLFIAAEGVSWMERWVRPFKTGAARIAFGAEARHDWQLGVKILPVGLSYSAPNLFRSEVIVHFGEPVTVAPWAEAEGASHEKAIEDFTLEIEERVRALVLDTRDEAGQTFVEQLETLLKDRFPKGADYFPFRKNLIEKTLDDTALRTQTAGYFNALQTARLSDTGLRTLAQPTAGFGRILMLILGLPCFLVGYTFWFLPCYLPWLLAKKMRLYIGYDSNVKMLVGLFTFPLALWGAARLLGHWLHNGWWALAAVTALLVLGYCTEQYLDLARQWKATNDARKWRSSHPELYVQLVNQRKNIVEMVMQSV